MLLIVDHYWHFQSFYRDLLFIFPPPTTFLSGFFLCCFEIFYTSYYFCIELLVELTEPLFNLQNWSDLYRLDYGEFSFRDLTLAFLCELRNYGFFTQNYWFTTSVGLHRLKVFFQFCKCILKFLHLKNKRSISLKFKSLFYLLKTSLCLFLLVLQLLFDIFNLVL